MNICTHCGERCAVVIDLALNVERMTLCFDCAATIAEMLYVAVMKLHAIETMRGQDPVSLETDS